MKPLEPGCLALVTHGTDAGVVVTCERFCPPGFRYRSAQTGDIRASEEDGWITADPDGMHTIRPAYSLMRIDGGEDESPAVEQESEVPA